jgi:glycosyltransferase involved in cell wall biosynthesis
MKKRIVIAVISDLVTDQRVHKVSLSLHKNGYEVLLLGAKRKQGKNLLPRSYKTKRMRMLFQKGPLFYAEWNLRLFFTLLFLRADAITANDLDTLPASFLAAKIKRCPVLYDSHEYFTEMEELQGRKRVKKIWERVEKIFLSRVQFIYTVNRSIAAIYEKKYGKSIAVVRNLPMQQSSIPATASASCWSPTNMNSPTNILAGEATNLLAGEVPNVLAGQATNVLAGQATSKGERILLCQGAGLHENRGLEELILSLKQLPEHYLLVLAGSGLAINRLKQLTKEQGLENRISFTGLVPMEELAAITRTAFVGFSLDKSTSLNNYYSLPNKIFDYMAAGVPVIASDMPEVKQVIEGYKTGIIIPLVTPQNIANAVLQLEADTSLYRQFAGNTKTAIKDLCWENECSGLLELYKRSLNK